MIGKKKLSTIRTELRVALAKEAKNPTAALDRKLRKLGNEKRSLVLLHGALGQLESEPLKPPRARRAKRSKMTV
jgi:hypothetical protein